MSAPPLPRDQFPVADRFRYLNHARVAAPPTVVAHALARDASAATMLGSTAHDRRAGRVEAVRRACAELLGADADDVTFVRSTTEGVGRLADALPWAPGDQVVLGDREYPLTVAPWRALADRGVEVVEVAAEDPGWTLPLDAVEAALVAGGGRVRVVVASWVQYARGGRTDLAALAGLCHRYGALVVADVIQGL
ncbi:MAG TPA: aminotransferase class V-fold PLP-dependent enzyme, partial [Aquihabitans sp.]|nr:aminotransferase class V-fold PLP-dependent enzyme [Aquihabitans sp.]